MPFDRRPPMLRPFGVALAAAALAGAAPVDKQTASPPASLYAFASPDDPSSAAGLDAVLPVWLQATGQDDTVQLRLDAVAQAAARRIGLPVWPVVQNARLGAWHGADVGTLVQSPARRAALLDAIAAQLKALGAAGLTFDFEDLPPSAQAGYLALLGEARFRLGPAGQTIAVAVPCCDPAWDLAAYGRAADRVIVMIYDQHWPAGQPGPIAALPWFKDAAARIADQVPPDRLVIGLASYGYDWPQGAIASPISIPEALARAAAVKAAPRRDPASGEMSFVYREGGVVHTIWFPDAAAAAAQVTAARALGVNRFALWRMGLEDPAIWAVLRAARAAQP